MKSEWMHQKHFHLVRDTRCPYIIFGFFGTLPGENFFRTLHQAIAPELAKVIMQFSRLPTIGHRNRSNGNANVTIHTEEANQKLVLNRSDHFSVLCPAAESIAHFNPEIILIWRYFNNKACNHWNFDEFRTARTFGTRKVLVFRRSDHFLVDSVSHVDSGDTLPNPRTQDWHPADQIRTSRLMRDSSRTSAASIRDDMRRLGTHG